MISQQLNQVIESYGWFSDDGDDDYSQPETESNSDSDSEETDLVKLQQDIEDISEYKAHKILRELQKGYDEDDEHNCRTIAIPLDFDGLDAYYLLGFDMMEVMKEIELNKSRTSKNLVYIKIEFAWGDMYEDIWQARYAGKSRRDVTYDNIKSALELLYYENVKIYLVEKQGTDTAISTFI